MSEPRDEQVERNTPPFAVIPAEAILDRNISNAEFRVLAAMYLHTNRRHVCWPKLDTLAEELQVSKQAISKIVLQLEEKGYLQIAQYGFPAKNKYRLLFDQSARAPQDAEDWYTWQDDDPESGSQLQSQPDVDHDDNTAHSQRHVDHTVNATLTNSQPQVDQQSTSGVDRRTYQRTKKQNREKGTNARATRGPSHQSQKGQERNDPEPPQIAPRDEAAGTDAARTSTPPTPPPPPERPQAMPPAWLWQRVYTHLRERSLVPPAQLASWITPCHIAHYGYDDDGMLRVDLSAPGQYVVDMIERKYLYLLQQAVGAVLGIPGSRVIVEARAVARRVETAENSTENSTDRKAAV